MENAWEEHMLKWDIEEMTEKATGNDEGSRIKNQRGGRQ